MLGNHPDIHTVSEPWLMLHPFYAMRSRGFRAEYDQYWAQYALREFLACLPGGEEEFFKGVRHMYGHLYNCARDITGKRFFLDKTPRYYLVIPELYRTFPDAKFIILLRNPLAVLCSIINTWVEDYWFNLKEYELDLKLAPRLLLQGKELLGDRGIVIIYEQLVNNSDFEVQMICKYLGIEYVPQMITYGINDSPRDWHLGDQTGVLLHDHPVDHIVDKWVQSLSSPGSFVALCVSSKTC